MEAVIVGPPIDRGLEIDWKRLLHSCLIRYPFYLVSLLGATALIIVIISIKYSGSSSYSRNSNELLDFQTVHSSIFFSIGISIPILTTLALCVWNFAPDERDIQATRVTSLRSLLGIEDRSRRILLCSCFTSILVFIPDVIIYARAVNNITILAASSTFQMVLISLHFTFMMERNVTTDRSEKIHIQGSAFLLTISSLSRLSIGLFPSVGLSLQIVYGLTTVASLLLLLRTLFKIIGSGKAHNTHRSLSALFLLTLIFAVNSLFVDSIRKSRSRWNEECTDEFAGYVYILCCFKVIFAIQSDFRVRFKFSVLQAASLLNKQYIRHITDETRDVMRYQFLLLQCLRDETAAATTTATVTATADSEMAQNFLSEIQSISDSLKSCLDQNSQSSYLADANCAHRYTGIPLDPSLALFDNFSSLQCRVLHENLTATKIDDFVISDITRCKYILDVEFSPASLPADFTFGDPILCFDNFKFRKAVNLLTQIFDPGFSFPQKVHKDLFIKLSFFPMTDQTGAGEFLQGVNQTFIKYLYAGKKRFHLIEKGVLHLTVGRLGYSVGKEEFEYLNDIGPNRPIASKFLIARGIIERFCGKLEIDPLATIEGSSPRGAFVIKMLYFERVPNIHYWHHERLRQSQPRSQLQLQLQLQLQPQSSILTVNSNNQESSAAEDSPHSTNQSKVAAAPNSLRASASKLKFLIIDDIKSCRRVLRRMLESMDHIVVEASGGESAMKIFNDSIECGSMNETFDCIIVDYEMPVINGPTLVTSFRSLGYNGYILGFTGISHADVDSMIQNGANKTLDKPILWNNIDSIVAEIRRHRYDHVSSTSSIVLPEAEVSSWRSNRSSNDLCNSVDVHNRSVDVQAISLLPYPSPNLSHESTSNADPHSNLYYGDSTTNISAKKKSSGHFFMKKEIRDSGNYESIMRGDSGDKDGQSDNGGERRGLPEPCNGAGTRIARSEGGLLTVSGLPSFVKFVKSSFHVLLVDDVRSNRKVIGQIFRRHGHTFEEAIDGCHAIELLRGIASEKYRAFNQGPDVTDASPKPDRSNTSRALTAGTSSNDKGFNIVQIKTHKFDAILIDHIMPNMDGPACVKYIRTELGLKIPIFGVTGNVIPEDMQLFTDSGLTGIMEKPIPTEDLIRLLTDCCG